jgi:hypothetical protein
VGGSVLASISSNIINTFTGNTISGNEGDGVAVDN